ncbi:hypothetical protein Aduo_011311 [Ancylostoma duodenale]
MHGMASTEPATAYSLRPTEKAIGELPVRSDTESGLENQIAALSDEEYSEGNILPDYDSRYDRPRPEEESHRRSATIALRERGGTKKIELIPENMSRTPFLLEYTTTGSASISNSVLSSSTRTPSYDNTTVIFESTGNATNSTAINDPYHNAAVNFVSVCTVVLSLVPRFLL